MADKELKTRPAALVTLNEDEENSPEVKEEEVKPKVGKSRTKAKAKAKPVYEYYVSGESAIELAGVKFKPGDVVTVRPIPEFYFASHVSRRRVN